MSKPSDSSTATGLPVERLIQPQLLLLLGLKSAHGYELIQRLNEANFTAGEVDPATVYRNLRRMNKEGLVNSHWEAGPTGPGRRCYTITTQGKEILENWVESIRQQKEKLEFFLKLYIKFRETDSNKNDE